MIIMGSGIGVTYKRPGNKKCHDNSTHTLCIHNGRFVKAIKSNGKEVYSLPDHALNHNNEIKSIMIVHAGSCKNNIPHACQLELKGIHEYRRIASYNMKADLADYCLDYRRGTDQYKKLEHHPDIILPEQMIAFCYIKSDTHKMDVHNGRYLFWVDHSGHHHCVLHGVSDIPKIRSIHYAHTNFLHGTTFENELSSKSDIKSVIKLPSFASKC